MCCQSSVKLLILWIKHQKYEIKTKRERLRGRRYSKYFKLTTIVEIFLKAHRDIKVCGNCMFSTTVSFSSQLDIRGLAAARIEARALSEQMIPAFAIERVCCSCNREDELMIQ